MSAVEQLRGVQRPRIELVQPYATSRATAVLELCDLAGLSLDEWQRYVLLCSLGRDEAGRWASPEVGLVLPRQNGKNEVLMARELAGLFVFKERLLVHTAHQYDTSLEAYRRLRFVVQNTPELDSRVHRYIGSHGEEGIELKDGCRIRFRTRTKGGGRGFSGDFVAFDEAMIFPEASLSAIMPIVSARPNPQVWYAGSAVDQMIHKDGLVLARVRRRAQRGVDRRLSYFEWSYDAATPVDVSKDEMADPGVAALANPAFGVRIMADYVAGEAAAMGSRAFAVERLGVGDWPDPDASVAQVIPAGVWERLLDVDAVLVDPVVLAVDVTPDRSSSSVSAGGVERDGRYMVEVVEWDRGTAWVVGEVLRLSEKHQPLVVAVDATGAAASLVPGLEAAGVQVRTVTSGEHAQACGFFYDQVVEGRVAHVGQPELAAALRGATQRPLGGAWAWNRRTSMVDLSPLVSATLALGVYHLVQSGPAPARPRVWNLNDLPE